MPAGLVPTRVSVRIFPDAILLPERHNDPYGASMSRAAPAHDPAPRTHTSGSRTTSDTPRALLYAALLVSAGVAAYSNVLRVPFLFDDKPHIVANAAIKPPLSLRALALTERPVLTLTLAANYAWGRLDVRGYHAVNVGLHIACALLLYGFARHVVRTQAGRANADVWRCDALAFVTAGIFLLHPLQTESVTYVVQRAEILAALAVVGGLWVAARWMNAAAGPPPGPLPGGEGVGSNQRPRTRNQGPGRTSVLLILIGTLGLLSKESAAVLPVLVALYDWCFVARGRPVALARRWPLYLTLLVPLALVGAWRVGVALEHGRRPGGVELGGTPAGRGGDVEDQTGAGPTPPAPFPAREGGSVSASAAGGTGRAPITPFAYLSWQPGVWLYYLRLILWPDRLCFDCGYQGAWAVWSSALGNRVWLPALALGGLAAGAWAVRRRWPLATFCLVAAAVALVPTSSLLPLSDAYVEHRLYLPIAFLAVLVVVGTDAMSQVAARWVPAGLVAAVCGGAVVMVLAGLGTLTHARNAVYADPVRLYEQSVAIAPENPRAQFNLANAYARSGQPDLAIARYQELIRLDPAPAPYYINLAEQYMALRRNPEALDALEKARIRAPQFAVTHRNLAVVYARLGRPDDAIASAEEATRLQPINAYGHRLLGIVYALAGRRDDAIRAYRAALFFNPNDADAQQRLRRLGAAPQ